MELESTCDALAANGRELMSAQVATQVAEESRDTARVGVIEVEVGPREVTFVTHATC